jgi:hypothetical protein
MAKYYDASGTYKAYTNDDKNLFSVTGEHLGYFTNGFLYNTKGLAIGHIKGSMILDKSGKAIYHIK